MECGPEMDCHVDTCCGREKTKQEKASDLYQQDAEYTRRRYNEQSADNAE